MNQLLILWDFQELSRAYTLPPWLPARTPISLVARRTLATTSDLTITNSALLLACTFLSWF